jgi:FixJ family two-component response regulator
MCGPFRLTHFAPVSAGGSDLADRVRRLGTRLGYEVRVLRATEAEQADFLLACVRDAAVVADCTIELGRGLSIYPVLTAQPNVLDHILVVGRSYLPLNVRGLREGGAPAYPQTFANHQIEAWLEPQLIDLRNQIAENRDSRVSIRRVEELSDRMSEVYRMMDASLTRKRKRAARQVFLSYRSCWFDQGAREFAERVTRDGLTAAEEGPRPVKIVPPGVLVHETEALSPMRRWMLVGLLDDMIRDSDEIWVYWRGDPKDNPRSYPQSWWTIGELVSAAYINQAGRTDGRSEGVRVRLYDADRDELRDLPPDLRIRLSEEQIGRFARVLSNTRPDTMGPENVFRGGQLQMLYDLGLGEDFTEFANQFLTNPMMRGLLEQMLPPMPPGEKEEMLRATVEIMTDPAQRKRYMDDEIHKPEFWSTASVQLGPTPAYHRERGIDVDTFLHVPMAELIPYTQEQLATTAANGSVIEVSNALHPTKASYRVLEQPARYLWRAVRMGIDTGPDAPGLEVLPTYKLEEVGSAGRRR